MKRLVVGILAHVDAGKTTLSESLLYASGTIRKLGRVDHKNAFLDTHELERRRGITIFSKQARFKIDDTEITLLDTPGHVDFSAEMERTLKVLDYAILVISGTEGIQGHTETLWRLLELYGIPTFIFVNKTDMVSEENGKEKLMQNLQQKLHGECIDFSAAQDETFFESIAMSDENVLEYYMENGRVEKPDIIDLIKRRRIFPCFFGSALYLNGVEEFLRALDEYTLAPEYRGAFGARIYKITHDEQGGRLTHMKITGGSLKVKTMLPECEEKTDQIRLYSGTRFEPVQEAEAGMLCAVTGLNKTFAGQGLGFEAEAGEPVLEPVLNYQIILPQGIIIQDFLGKLRSLEEEEPELHIVWNEQLKEIHVQLMGEVQLEILKSLISERFGIEVSFGNGNIVYKETISNVVEGAGHFEPLRHYAEVHLLMEPIKRGGGLKFESRCSTDELDRNWQRLVLTHLQEKQHIGVLTGSPITDMKITLVGGRAHIKHTEGGDFRQATYRAVRNGLMKAESVLLEPYYDFRMELPAEMVGRAMTDIQNRSGTPGIPETDGEFAVLTGMCPVATMQNYSTELAAYTKGRGRISLTLRGYEVCHNPSEVIAASGYDCDRDILNPAGSVFCSQGSGFEVSWDKAAKYMHVPMLEDLSRRAELEQRPININKSSGSGGFADEKELEAIFARTYGEIKRVRNDYHYNPDASRPELKNRDFDASSEADKRYEKKRPEKPKKNYLLVDGYNIIFAWDELKTLAEHNLESARNRLMDILCNYQAYKSCVLILVFDAYKVKGGKGSIFDYHNIHVVYTKEAETADMYIEKTTNEIGHKHNVTVATSDGLEQIIILGQGAVRISARDLKTEIDKASRQIEEEITSRSVREHNYLLDNFDGFFEK